MACWRNLCKLSKLKWFNLINDRYLCWESVRILWNANIRISPEHIKHQCRRAVLMFRQNQKQDTLFSTVHLECIVIISFSSHSQETQHWCLVCNILVKDCLAKARNRRRTAGEKVYPKLSFFIKYPPFSSLVGVQFYPYTFWGGGNVRIFCYIFFIPRSQIWRFFDA